MGIIYKNGIPYGNQPSTDAVAMIEPSEEASATSAHAYAVGEHFIYNDTLYRATAAIAIGDTITPDTNCVATNVMTEVESGGGGGGSEKLNSTQAADAYDPTATYAVGDKVSYAGNVYSCISAISTPEAWDSTHWDQVDPIQDQVDDVRNTLNQLDNGLQSVGDGIAQANIGDAAQTQIAANALVYVTGHSTLPNGLYQEKNGTGIQQGVTLSNTNLKSPSNVLNSLLIPTKGTLIPTMPDTDTTVHTGVGYVVLGSIVYFNFSIKITNAQTGFANRKSINLNMPSYLWPDASLDFICSNGNPAGYTVARLTDGGYLTIYPQTTGTTYAIGFLMYIIN